MPAILLIFPDELLSRVDALVYAAKTAQTRMAQVSLITHAERQEAIKIAEKSGQAAANRYLHDLQAPRMPPRISRTSVLIKFIEKGLADEALAVGSKV